LWPDALRFIAMGKNSFLGLVQSHFIFLPAPPEISVHTYPFSPLSPLFTSIYPPPPFRTLMRDLFFTSAARFSPRISVHSRCLACCCRSRRCCTVKLVTYSLTTDTFRRDPFFFPQLFRPAPTFPTMENFRPVVFEFYSFRYFPPL